MYRLINSKSLAQNNFKILKSPRCWDLCCGRILSHQPFALFCINSLERYNNATAFGTGKFNVSNLGYVSSSNDLSGFSTNIFTTIRPQSTTPNADLLSQRYQKKRRRFKSKKFADLIASELYQLISEQCVESWYFLCLVNNGGELLETKASVQKLKSKQLTDFIETSQLFTKKDSKKKNTSSSSNNSNYAVIKLGADDVGGDEAPVLFVGCGTPNLTKGTSQLAEIILSYKMFKEMNVDADYRDYVTEESVDFLDHTASSVKDFAEPAYIEDDLEQHLDEDPLASMDIVPAKTEEMPSTKVN